jgi:hypothetical protein
MMFIFAASIAPESEPSSHGRASAVDVAGGDFTVETSC